MYRTVVDHTAKRAFRAVMSLCRENEVAVVEFRSPEKVTDAHKHDKNCWSKEPDYLFIKKKKKILLYRNAF